MERFNGVLARIYLVALSNCTCRTTIYNMNLHQLSKAIKLNTITPAIKPRDGAYYDNLVNNPEVMESRPWKNDIKYFTKSLISLIALLKMLRHAVSGGNIEIMGMLVGKIHENSIIVNDVYPLPVEGTETRVNAQIEGYEFMVSYLTQNKLIKPNENIVGWYHSHPGYGCWLSGIDVATQVLNQSFQDPYMAIVIDPKKSLQQGSIEIGAFRTFPDEYVTQLENLKQFQNKSKKVNDELGMYSHKYYSLDIEIFKNNDEEKLMKFIGEETWINELLMNEDVERSHDENKYNRIDLLISKLNKATPHLNISRLQMKQQISNIFEQCLNSPKTWHNNVDKSEGDDDLMSGKTRHIRQQIKLTRKFEQSNDTGDIDTEPTAEYDDDDDDDDDNEDYDNDEDEYDSPIRRSNETDNNDEIINNNNTIQTNPRLGDVWPHKDPIDNRKTTELLKLVSSYQYRKLINLDIETKLFL